MCQCPGGLWLFDTALGEVVHPRNREGFPGTAREFGHKQGMTNKGGALPVPDSEAAASGTCLALGSWKSPSTELRGKSAQPPTPTVEGQGEVCR